MSVDSGSLGGDRTAKFDSDAGTFQIRPENRTVSDNFQLAGRLWRFQPVCGSGIAEVARLAELQHGHVHLEQLRAAGIKRGALSRWVRSGMMHPALPAVYLVGRPHADVLGRMMAAALHFRGDGLVAGRAALQLWGLLDTTQQLERANPIEVLLAGGSGGACRGLKVHRTGVVDRQDVRSRQGIPVVSPALALLHAAGGASDYELEAILSAALRGKLVRRSQVLDVISRNRRAKGRALLRSLVDAGDAPHDTRSGYERKLLDLLKQAELPLPVTNVRVAGMLVDAFWPEFKLVVEFDGWRYHGRRDGFEADRVRDQRLTAVGHQVMRVTARQIDNHPYALVARVAGTIAMLRIRRDPEPHAPERSGASA